MSRKIDKLPEATVMQIVEAYNRGDTYSKMRAAFNLNTADIAALRRKLDLIPRNLKLTKEGRTILKRRKQKASKQVLTKKAPPKKKVARAWPKKSKLRFPPMKPLPAGNLPTKSKDVASTIAEMAQFGFKLEPDDEVIALRYDALTGTCEVDVRRYTKVTLTSKL